MRQLGVILGMMLLGLSAVPAHAGSIKWDEGKWRLELSALSGIHQGTRDRSGDLNLNAVAEYESPMGDRWALGLRLQPLFYYLDDIDDVDSFGIGFGPALRLYQKKEERRGWFTEISVTALIHSPQIHGNSSSINFSNELGVGYKFKNKWHVSGKWRHISNGSLGDKNAAANGVGFGIGFTF